MRFWIRRLIFSIINIFILCSLLFHPVISNSKIRTDNIDNKNFVGFNIINIIYNKQNLEYIENTYEFKFFGKMECSCDQNKEKVWYPKILCSLLFMKVGILNIRIFYLEIVYLIFRLKVILNKIMDLLDAKSRFIDLMEVFNCLRIPNY